MKTFKTFLETKDEPKGALAMDNIRKGVIARQREKKSKEYEHVKDEHHWLLNDHIDKLHSMMDDMETAGTHPEVMDRIKGIRKALKR